MTMIVRHIRWSRLFAVALLAFVPVLAVADPAGAASTSTGTKPVVNLIPAFSTDLPLSGASLRPAPSADVNSAAALASWVCSIYASDPSKFANTIEGEGWQSCTGSGWSPQRLKVTLQKYKGLGFWNNLTVRDSGNAYVNFVHGDFIYDCSGLGTQTYRVVTDGYAVGGLYHKAVQSLNYLRVSC
jgi:hypothetical protein